MKSRWLTCWLVASVALWPVAASAQSGGGETLFTSRDAVWAAGFTAGTLVLAPLDVSIAAAVRDSAFQQQPLISLSAGGLRLLGLPGTFLITGGMYVLGRLTDRPVLADIGLHSGEAVALATAITLGTKTLAGRARPYTDEENSLNFGLGRGWRNDAYQSLPSGHATVAFATAAAITAEVEERWPESELAVGGALFSAATLVGVSRLYHNVHWATDVMLAAGIGTFAGWKTTRYAHRSPDNRIDRWLLGVTLSPSPAGTSARLWLLPAF